MHIYYVDIAKDTGLELGRRFWMNAEPIEPGEDGKPFVYANEKFIGCFSSRGYDHALQQCLKLTKKGTENEQVV